MRWHSSILDVLLLRAADCVTDHYLLVTEIREKLAVNKQTMYMVHVERINIKKLNKVEGKN
jgi:hypothetical protein